MLTISSKAGAGRDSSPHGSVRLIERLPMVTSLVIRSEQTCSVVSGLRLSPVGDFLPELLRRQQSPQPAQFLITQPARSRYPPDQQGDPVRAHVQDVLAALDAPKFTDGEVTEWYGRRDQRTNEQTTRYGQRGRCHEHARS